MAQLPYPVHGNMETQICWDHNSALLLAACGYTCTHYPADWEDIGGRKTVHTLLGGPAYCVWVHPCGHEIVVAEGVAADWGMPF